MKRRKFILVVFLVAILIAGCAKRDTPYFPVKSGLTRLYQFTTNDGYSGTFKLRIIENRNIAGKNCTPIISESDNSSIIEFVTVTDTGVYKIASQSMSDAEPRILSQPECVLKFPLKVGTTWNYSEKTWLFPNSLYSVKKSVLYEAKVESVNEIVTTQAGTFNNCVKISKYGKTSIKVGMFYFEKNLPVKLGFVEWYAPDIGLVKAIYRQTLPDNLYGVNSTEMYIQLQSIDRK